MSNVTKSDEGWARLREHSAQGLRRPAFRRFRDHRPRKTAMQAVPKVIAAAQQVITSPDGENVVRGGRKLRKVVIG